MSAKLFREPSSVMEKTFQAGITPESRSLKNQARILKLELELKRLKKNTIAVQKDLNELSKIFIERREG